MQMENQEGILRAIFCEHLLIYEKTFILISDFGVKI